MSWLKKAAAQNESQPCLSEKVTATASFTAHKRQEGFTSIGRHTELLALCVLCTGDREITCQSIGGQDPVVPCVELLSFT